VGFALSPPVKRLFGDQINAPAVIRAIFGELAKRPEDDLFFVLNYDGEFSQSRGFTSVAGTPEAEDRMSLSLLGVGPETTREQALERALKAWAMGAMETRRRKLGHEDEEPDPLVDLEEGAQGARFLREELKTSQVEVGILDRFTARESKFRLLTGDDLKALLAPYV
jgi:proteasome alpha subunit